MTATFVTDFADQAVILPLLAVVAAALWWAGWPRGAMAWTMGLGLALSTIGLLKLAAIIGHAALPCVGLLSPSGHTAAAAATSGAIMALLGRRGAPGRALIASILVGTAIGWSRVQLGAHVWTEVVMGMAVGFCGTLVTIILAGAPPVTIRRDVVMLCVLGVAVATHGRHLAAEPVITRLGDWVAKEFVASIRAANGQRPPGAEHLEYGAS